MPKAITPPNAPTQDIASVNFAPQASSDKVGYIEWTAFLNRLNQVINNILRRVPAKITQAHIASRGIHRT